MQVIPPGIDPDGTLILVDLSWWLNRAYYAAREDAGEVPRIVTANLAGLLGGECASHLAVAVDSLGETWRHRVARDAGFQYKAGRKPKPPEFYRAAEEVERIVRAHRIPVLCAEGHEADDVFAAARVLCRRAALRLVMLGIDKDFLQLVDATTFRWAGGAQEQPVRRHDVFNSLGVWPEQVPDYLGIVGDASDKIPGVRGLGPVAARGILQQFIGIEAALFGLSFENMLPTGPALPKVTMRALLRLKESAREAQVSKRLATLDPGCSIPWDVQAMAVGGWDVGELAALYYDLGLTRLADDVRECPKAPWPPEREPGEDDE